MKTLTVRNLEDEVAARFAEVAAANHRNAEAHARFLIEREVSAQPADTGGELSERVWSDPAPAVDLKAVDSYLAHRGRRSPRPA
jgi:plasmid stability protein